MNKRNGKEQMNMLQTVKAEVDVDGNVRLLEPLRVTKPSRALVTLLDTEEGSVSHNGNAADVLKFLQEHRLPDEARPSAEEIEAHIQEARESWE
jgi:hypothetical protein